MTITLLVVMLYSLVRNLTSVEAELKSLSLFTGRNPTVWHPADVNTKVQLFYDIPDLQQLRVKSNDDFIGEF